MYKIVIFISFNPFVFHIIRTGIIELKITNWLLTFFGTWFFLATTMFLVFRKFWNLLVRKVARSTNREIELTRLFEHISRSLIQLFRRFVASDRVNSKPIRCGLSDYTLPIEKWFHPSSDSCTIFPFFCPICVSSLRLFLLLCWEDERNIFSASIF